MPLLFVVGIVGAVAIWRPRHEQPGLAPLRALTVGGLAAGLGVIAIPFVNQRYLSDFMPLLVVVTAAGLYAIMRRAQEAPPARRPAVRAVVAAGVALAIVSVWFNVGLALQYQRAYSPFTATAERAAFVRFQHDARRAPPRRAAPTRPQWSRPAVRTRAGRNRFRRR